MAEGEGAARSPADAGHSDTGQGGVPGTARGGPFSLGAMILGGAAALLVLFLLAGYLLPAEWDARAEAHLAAPPSEVFASVATPEGWRSWTPWPDSGVVRTGPSLGPGARLSWDDRELGSGTFTIVEVDPPRLVRYTVVVGPGAMRTAGTLTLAPERGGTRVVWREEGDLGRNPLMGYWARSMRRAQSAELAKGLDRLRALLFGAVPADSGRTR